jgi:hypothetical protein
MPFLRAANTGGVEMLTCVLDAGNIDKPVVISAYDTACEPTKLYLKPPASQPIANAKDAGFIRRAGRRDKPHLVANSQLLWKQDGRD